MRLEHSVSEVALGDRWNCTDWHQVALNVEEMQREISLASLNGDFAKLEVLTERFLTSVDARMLAVYNVTKPEATTNPGRGEPWVTPADKMKGAMLLSHQDYVSEPFYTFTMFESKTKKDRDMCIPTYYDRAMHDLYRMLMEPIAEPVYDVRLFSSRKGRSLADAVEEIRRIFSADDAPEWVIRGDVKSFYDSMSHEWMLDNIPIDREVLAQFLDPGRIREGSDEVFHVRSGVPTGNRLSPVLANLILNGIGDGIHNEEDPANGMVVRWVDDLVIAARTEADAKRYMEHVSSFLAERGMQLNEKKSYIVRRDEGFEFLKFDFRMVGNRMEVRPTKESVEEFMLGVRKAIHAYGGEEKMVGAVNDRIRGFVTKYRISDLSEIAEKLDKEIIEAMIGEVEKHSLLSRYDIISRFVRKDEWGEPAFISPRGKFVTRIASFPRVPHERVWLTANPYIDREYFRQREERMRESKVVKNRDLWRMQKGRCAICGMVIGHDQPRRVIADSDGSIGFIHSDCQEDTARTRAFGMFRKPLSDAPADDNIEQEDNPKETPAVPVEIVEAPVKETSDEPTKEEVTSISPIIVPPAENLVETPGGKPSKFQPLADYLRGTNMSFVDLNIDVIDQLMGGNLCESAKTSPRYWAKQGPGSVNEALAQVGWGVDSAHNRNGYIRFKNSPKSKPEFEPAELEYIRRRDPMKGKERTAERDAAMAKRRYGRFTEFLLGCGMDQVKLSFKEIGDIIGFRLPENAWVDKKFWCNRKDIQILAAIEAGDFMKTKLDMDNLEIILTRACCIPEPEKENVREGYLMLKPKMMR